MSTTTIQPDAPTPASADPAPGLDYAGPVAEKPFSGQGYQLPTWPFRVPPEIADGSRHGRHPVVVVGAGLAGLTAACELALRGIPAIVLDEDDTVGVRGASSRGICYAQKSLEVFRRLGIFDRVAAKGVRWSVGRTLAGNDVVYSFDLSNTASPEGSRQPPFINLQQFYVEWFLAERAMELGHVDLRWKSRVVGVTQDDDSVTLQVDTPAGRYAVQADWVIDATGIHSPIRNAFGLQTHAAAGVDRWCISDVRFRSRPPIERWTWVEAPFNENRAVWQHLMADDVWRLDYQMEPDADPEHVSRAEVVAERLRRQFGDGVEYELVWVGPYAYRSHLLDTFRHDRVLFIGDCAHVMSPFGARGGNSGIQDADNLVWKLALVLEGRASPALLDSYHDERREGAIQNITITNRTARFLSPRSPAERMIRNAIVSLAREFPFAQPLVNTGRLSSANTYSGSCLVLGRGAGRSIQNVAIDAPAGDLAGLLEGGGLRTMLFAADAAAARTLAACLSAGDAGRVSVTAWLLADDAQAPDAGAAANADADAALPVVRSPALARQLGLAAGEVAIVRPDLYHAGCLPATDAAARLARALDAGSGAAPHEQASTTTSAARRAVHAR